MGKSKAEKEKLNKELEELEELRKLDKIMKKESIEGLFLSNASKDSETIRDTVVDEILDKYRINTEDQRNIDTIERLAYREKIVKKPASKKPAKSAVKDRKKKRFKIKLPSIAKKSKKKHKKR
jgi:hypothetical protein